MKTVPSKSKKSWWRLQYRLANKLSRPAKVAIENQKLNFTFNRKLYNQKVKMMPSNNRFATIIFSSKIAEKAILKTIAARKLTKRLSLPGSFVWASGKATKIEI